MKSQNHTSKKANFFFLCFLLAFLTVLFSVYQFGNLSLKKDRIQAQNAVFDFEKSPPLQGGQRYYLQGDWEFYYDVLLKTAPPSKPVCNELFPVPASYAGNLFKSTPYPSGGIASYRAYIDNLESTMPLTIYVPNLACAYRVFVDGVLVTESGELTNTGKGSWATPSSIRQKIELTPNRHEIVIEVSAEGYSGLYLTPVITGFWAADQYENTTISLRYTFAGTIFYAAVVLLFVVIFSKRRYFSPYLPLLFLCLSLRMMISTEGYIVSQPFLFSLSYEKMAMLTFLSTFIIKIVSLIYFKDELNLPFSLKMVAFFSSLFLLVAVGVSLLPNFVYNNYYFVTLQLISMIADLFLINQLCLCSANGNKNAGLFTWAYFFILFGITIDAIYANGFLPVVCSYLTPASLSLFAFLLTVIHARRGDEIYRTAQEAKELERALEKANMSVMISQIQPHFLYNALNTIKSLIRRDPKTAEKAIIDFSYYLRGNMDSLSHTEPIPFQTELQHVQYYCNIELLRFSDKLTIAYDIQADNFCVPTLSVQPLVENAIKHGVTKKAEGGFVKLSTYQDDAFYIICVEDNGIGFDPEALPKEDGRSHVGLQNIRYRFKSMLSADMTIESEPNVGTKVCIRIPKVQKPKNRED